jgi:glycosyltransferase involved in cell wall biosynthesis
MRQDFEAQVKSSRLQQNFIFLGRRKDVPEILACCDCAVLRLLAERMPNAVLEYLAAGLPVVASALGGNLEVIRDGITGLLVPLQDSSALAKTLERLLAEDGLAKRLGAAAREHVTSNFSFDRLVAEVDRIYTAQLHAVGAQ